MKLPTSIKQQWLEALRSGKYEQGKGYLESHGKYCCLGVLQKELDGDVERMVGRSRCLPSSSWCESHGLPFQFWVDHFTGIDLSYMNDNLNYSFEQIAEVIDEHM